LIGTEGWEQRRELFGNILRDDWRKLAESLIVRGMMIFTRNGSTANANACRLESAALSAARWPAATCPLGLHDNIMHQCYHLLQYKQLTNTVPSQFDTILEIGGGFGAMHAALRYHLFSGNYYIHDFPEMMGLQERYAEACGLPAPTRCNGTADMPQTPDLAIALWSMSEMPLESAREIMATIRPRQWLMAYSAMCDGNAAQPWADEVMADNRWKWTRLQATHPDACYLFGT